MATEIPIRNIWVLMLYASDLYQLPKVGNSGVEDRPDDIPELIAEILCDSVEKRLRLNLTASFRTERSNLDRVRGRIMILETTRKRMLDRGKVACEFEALSIDTARNRYVLTALEKCLRKLRDPKLSSRCRKSISALRSLGVANIRPSDSTMSLERFTRNDYNDRLMLSASKFAHDMTIPNENMGKIKLNRPGHDERWFRALFEKAVSGFYRVAATPLGWKVQPGKWLKWQVEEKSDRIEELMPNMKTDIFLEHRHKQRRIVIDTKFNEILVPGQYRADTFRSRYIYQIYAYVQSQSPVDTLEKYDTNGILLHPATGEDLDECVRIQGNTYRFATVDLAGNTGSIKSRLQSLLDPSVVTR